MAPRHLDPVSEGRTQAPVQAVTLFYNPENPGKENETRRLLKIARLSSNFTCGRYEKKYFACASSCSREPPDDEINVSC